jgi:hypothetical protein
MTRLILPQGSHVVLGRKEAVDVGVMDCGV